MIDLFRPTLLLAIAIIASSSNSVVFGQGEHL